MGRPAGWMRAITGREAMRSPGAPSKRRSSPDRRSATSEVFYNRQRRHTSLEYLPPLEFEARQVSFATEPADKLQTVCQTG